MGELKLRGHVWRIRYYRDGRRYEESNRSPLHRVARDLRKNREGDVATGAPSRRRWAG